MQRYTVYGELDSRDSVALATILVAKGLPVRWVPESPSLALALASRAGREVGPYLRTPEGFVLADLHAILDWIERTHPEPALMPRAPVRRICARILEDWIELWLPGWPRRSWSSLEGLGRHLDAAGYLLGASPRRPDWLLAAWLETEVLVHAHARAHLARHAPRLVSLGEDLLGAAPAPAADDVVPISLLPILEEIVRDYHAYLVGNQAALKDHGDRVLLDLGLGRRPLPVRLRCERRRVEIGRELAGLPPEARRDVRRVLEPVGAWHAYTLPVAVPEVDVSDPRSL